MKKVTKKQRKLLRGGNAMVQRSIKFKNKIGEYIGSVPEYHNRAIVGQIDEFIKVQPGVPFIRPSLHSLY